MPVSSLIEIGLSVAVLAAITETLIGRRLKPASLEHAVAVGAPVAVPVGGEAVARQALLGGVPQKRHLDIRFRSPKSPWTGNT